MGLLGEVAGGDIFLTLGEDLVTRGERGGELGCEGGFPRLGEW